MARDAEPLVLELFDECGDSLHRYLRSQGLATDVAEDIVQDTFLALFRHLRMGRDQSNLRGWLFRVAHNLACRHRRSPHHRLIVGGLAETIAFCASGGADPERALSERQRWRRWRLVVQALPERDRRCLALRAEGLRYREIARVLGVSLGAVAKSMSRAIARLARAERG